MSEKIFAWLLRLYPSRFRADYGNEALQLLRDRVRDEEGFLSKMQLWFDLLATEHKEITDVRTDGHRTTDRQPVSG